MLRTILALAASTMATTAYAAAPSAPKDLAAAAEPANAFAGDLYGTISQREGNLFISPYSIHSALGMTLAGAGAGSQTAQQMQSVLHVPNADAAAAAFSTLATHLDEVRKTSDFQLNIANSLWAEQSISIEARFLDLLKNRYSSELMKVSYRKDPEDARLRINAWVSDKTNQKIPDLIPSGALTPETRLVLANAIYFEATWLTPFTKAATRDGDFTTSAGKKITAKMMHEEIKTQYAQTDDLQVLDLPYKRGATSMLILLPKGGTSIAPAEQRLTSLHGLQFRRATVQTTLPRFKLRYQADVAQTLAKMGMLLAFSNQADFSGMTKDERVAISNVIHEAYVDVNEDGTEAAAATAVTMRALAMPIQQEVVTFTADHPFLFLIRDNASGAILFIGRLADPS